MKRCRYEFCHGCNRLKSRKLLEHYNLYLNFALKTFDSSAWCETIRECYSRLEPIWDWETNFKCHEVLYYAYSCTSDDMDSDLVEDFPLLRTLEGCDSIGNTLFEHWLESEWELFNDTLKEEGIELDKVLIRRGRTSTRGLAFAEGTGYFNVEHFAEYLWNELQPYYFDGLDFDWDSFLKTIRFVLEFERDKDGNRKWLRTPEELIPFMVRNIMRYDIRHHLEPPGGLEDGEDLKLENYAQYLEDILNDKWRDSFGNCISDYESVVNYVNSFLDSQLESFKDFVKYEIEEGWIADQIEETKRCVT